MLDIFRTRLHQGMRTMAWPQGDPPPLPDRFRGRPELSGEPCPENCRQCLLACPTGALATDEAGKLRLDMGKCLFCGACETACSAGRVRFTREFRLGAVRREDLVVHPGDALPAVRTHPASRLFSRSLKLRQVSAGGCNACEADCNVLGTVGWDLGRFGISFVASPRHADGILVTGPVPENMHLALLKTWEAVPSPKVCIVVGSCAISGGPFAGHDAVHDGVSGDAIPVDLFVPGCPPHPLTILEALLSFLGRI